MTAPRVVLVTGSSSGIGQATALLAAERGDPVVLLARSAEKRARSAPLNRGKAMGEAYQNTSGSS